MVRCFPPLPSILSVPLLRDEFESALGTREKLDMKVFCGRLGKACEVGTGNRVIERKTLDATLP